MEIIHQLSAAENHEISVAVECGIRELKMFIKTREKKGLHLAKLINDA